MLRSSEIKPLFVDLSLCDKSFSFFYLFYIVGAYASEPLIFLSPFLMWSAYAYVGVVAYAYHTSMSAYSNECCPLCVRI